MTPKFWKDIPNFEPHEFGPEGEKMDEKFMKRLQSLRNLYRKPMHITSGYRSVEHNQAVGGATSSLHLQGRAADIRVAGRDAFELMTLALAVGFKGIGIKQHGPWGSRFIHLDDRDEETLWTYGD